MKLKVQSEVLVLDHAFNTDDSDFLLRWQLVVRMIYGHDNIESNVDWIGLFCVKALVTHKVL